MWCVNKVVNLIMSPNFGYQASIFDSPQIYFYSQTDIFLQGISVKF